MELEDKQSKKWLVKSSTRIMGPYSIDEVQQLLSKKHISVIDEIRESAGRWTYIRENKMFGEVVEKLRVEQDSAPENTQTMTATIGTQTSVTITRWDGTNTGITPPPDELTPPPVPQTPGGRPGHVSNLAKSDVLLGDGLDKMKDINPSKVTSTDRSRIGGGGTYGISTDGRVLNELGEKKSMLNGAFWVVALVAAAGVIWYFTMNTKQKTSSYDVLIQQAIRYKNLQLNELALTQYKKAAALREPSPEVQKEMALNLIVLDRQLVQGRRLLETELQREGGGRGQTIDAGLGVAMSYVLEGSLKEAEQTLQKMLVVEPQNYMVRLNLALIDLRKGDSVSAERILDDLMKRQADQPIVLLARLMAAIDSGSAKDPLVRNHLMNATRLYLNEHAHMKQELLLTLGLLGNNSDMTPEYVVNTFLTTLPFQSNLFVKDLRIDWKLADWDVLEKYCREYLGRISATPRTKAMGAVCLALATRDFESRKLLEEALLQAPKDPYVLVTQANLLYKNSLRNEAFAVLQMPEVAGLPSTDNLLGKICFDQGDLACAEKSFRSVLAKGFDATAQAGLAFVLAKQGNTAVAMDLVREGLRREPTYIPFITFRENYEVGNK